jgi:superfamily II DNA or RNA helicase
VSAEHLDGQTDIAERDAILQRLDEGRTLVVTNCGVLCEGWDQPSVKCAVLARPTKSLTLYLQQAGRILRPWNDQAAIILDHGGCALEHGLPQDERVYSLDSKPKQKRSEQRERAIPVKVCDECHAVNALAAGVCEACGFVFERGSVPEEEAGQLVEIRTSTPRSNTRVRPMPSAEYFEQLLATEPSAAWARARFQVETRVRPPESRA